MSMLRLERVTARDLAFLRELASDPAVIRFTRAPNPPREGFADEWLAAYEAGRAAGTREGFVVVDAHGTRLGLALAPRIEREAATAELGYVVAPEARGRGVATFALGELTRWALDELGAERCELLISTANSASQRVAGRCGYALEGVLRSVYVKPGMRDDLQIWSRLRVDVAV